TEYEYGTVVELTANPAEGWTFIEWQGDLDGRENPAQITVEDTTRVTAFFEIDQVEKSFYLGDNGVTIMCPDAEVGDTGTINGLEYTKRSRDMITPENASATCTSGITYMSDMFRDEADFNEDISHWDVSNVTLMTGMFANAGSFNQNIGEWDVSNVTNMREMFLHSTSFNQDIGGWDVGSVTNMGNMFSEASSFNQDLSNWDLRNVMSTWQMFRHATSFNGDVSG
uniref:BspA family leucine-rich repeat surface protein n=1 Tax=Rhodohalobacter halophilus TaxID=1812810 RepID=UPI000A424A40